MVAWSTDPGADRPFPDPRLYLTLIVDFSTNIGFTGRGRSTIAGKLRELFSMHKIRLSFSLLQAIILQCLFQRLTIGLWTRHALLPG